MAEGSALPGDTTLLEAVGTTPVAETQEKILYTYTIRPGDTLWDIAKWVLKDPFQWPEMLKYNYIENPDLIFPGDRLIVPSPEVLERIRAARDVQEIADIRREAEIGAALVELPPPAQGLSAVVTPLAGELVRVPLVEPVSNTVSASDLKITGRKSINFRYREYRGGVSPYYFSSGYTRQESLNLTLSGQIENTVKVNGEFYQSDQALENRYALTLATEEMELFLGDFAASLPDTEFLLSGRNLSGGRFRADFKTAGGTALAGASKGQAKYQRFFGNRAQGPYYLSQASVVFESETVLVNKVPQERGSDYAIDFITGQITFLRRVIDDITMVEVVYESRQTVFARSLYAGRVWGRPLSWLRLAGSLVREEDPKASGIVDLGSGNTLTPIGHWVAGSDVAADIPGFGTLTGEVAYSRFASNRLSAEVAEGLAVKSEMSGSLGPMGAAGYYRRTTPEFQRVGGAQQGSDLLNYGGRLDLKTGGPYTLAGAYDFKDVLLESLRETTTQVTGLAGLHSRGWPTAAYQYFQLQVQNDAPPPERLDHETRRHTGLVGFSRDYFEADARADLEIREGELASRGTAETRSLALGAATKNLGWIAASAGLEHQTVAEKGNSLTPERVFDVTKADVHGSFHPHDRYRLSVDNNWVWDEGYGSTQTLDTKLDARPVNEVRLDAKYTWETLQSLISSVYVLVYTQTASGQLEVLPIEGLSLRLTPSLRWTTPAGRQETLNASRTDLGSVKWAQSALLSHEAEVRRDLYLLADSTDPGLRLQTEQESRAASYTLKAAVSPAFSAQAGASYEQYYKYNFNAGFNDFDRLRGRHRIFSLSALSSLAEVLRLDGAYELDLRVQDGTNPESVTRTAYPVSETGQTTAQYDLLNSYGQLHIRQDTARAKATYQWTGIFSSFAEGTYNRNEDLNGHEPVIHTAAPGAGVILRWEKFRAEVSARLAKSWGGVSTHQENYMVTLNYNPLSLLSLSLRGQHTKTLDPDSLATEVDLNCSVQF